MKLDEIAKEVSADRKEKRSKDLVTPKLEVKCMGRSLQRT